MHKHTRAFHIFDPRRSYLVNNDIRLFSLSEHKNKIEKSENAAAAARVRNDGTGYGGARRGQMMVALVVNDIRVDNGESE